MPTEVRKLKTLIAQRSVEQLKTNELNRVAESALVNWDFHYSLKWSLEHIDNIREIIKKNHFEITTNTCSQGSGNLETHTNALKLFDNTYYFIQTNHTKLLEIFTETPENKSVTKKQNWNSKFWW